MLPNLALGVFTGGMDVLGARGGGLPYLGARGERVTIVGYGRYGAVRYVSSSLSGRVSATVTATVRANSHVPRSARSLLGHSPLPLATATNGRLGASASAKGKSPTAADKRIRNPDSPGWITDPFASLRASTTARTAPELEQSLSDRRAGTPCLAFPELETIRGAGRTSGMRRAEERQCARDGEFFKTRQ
ncbi:hypothetical protein V497_08394, partial [Pseudogymnoascus sp. VKM F-4516 (FW-969)]